jgi:phosphate transport system substrate-binding protein
MRRIGCILIGLWLANPAAAEGLSPPPSASPPGVLRIWGNAMMGEVVGRWSALYRDRHPDVRVEVQLTGSDVAMAGLYTGQADIALLGREATEMEAKAFEWIFRYPPFGIEVMTGSVGAAGKSPALAVMVHAGNPLSEISLRQLAAVFGYEERAIRNWDGLGLGGEWTGRSIRLYAPDAESGTGRFFRERVLAGSNKMAWDRLHEYPEPVLPAGHVDSAGRDIVAALAADPAGMALASIDLATDEVKVVAVSQPGMPSLTPSEESVGSRQYPLTRGVFAYVNRPASGEVDSETAAFIDLVLSPEGQAELADAGYLPLPRQPVSVESDSAYVESSFGYGVDARRRDAEVAEEEVTSPAWRGQESPFVRLAAGADHAWPARSGGSTQLHAYADHVAFDRLTNSSRTSLDLDAGQWFRRGSGPATVRTGLAYKLRLRDLQLQRQTTSVYARVECRGIEPVRLAGSYAFGVNDGPAAGAHSTQRDLKLQADFRPLPQGRLSLRIRYLDEYAAAGYDGRRLLGAAIDYRHQWHGLGAAAPTYLVIGANGSATRYRSPRPGNAVARADNGSGTHVTVGQAIGDEWNLEVDASIRQRDSNLDLLDRKSGRVEISARRFFR